MHTCMAHWICRAIASKREFMVFVMELVADLPRDRRHRSLDVSCWPQAGIRCPAGSGGPADSRTREGPPASMFDGLSLRTLRGRGSSAFTIASPLFNSCQFLDATREEFVNWLSAQRLEPVGDWPEGRPPNLGTMPARISRGSNIAGASSTGRGARCADLPLRLA
jgi:hypothetical protein